MLVEAKRRAYGLSTAVLNWHYRRNWGMTIGEGVRISRSAKMDKTNPKGVKIGDWTAVAFDASILTHDFINRRHMDVQIGSFCLVGARAVIMPGVKIGDHCVVGTGAVVFSDVPDGCAVAGNPARVVERGLVTGKWGIRDPDFLADENVKFDPTRGKRLASRAGRAAVADAPPTSGRELLASYLPGLGDVGRPFCELGIDSFSLITLRAEIEETEGKTISDEDWTTLERPGDLLRFITRPKHQQEGDVVGATTRRAYQINMPQMAMGGLSEGWLFKEVGDIHWSLLTSALGVQSRDIADQAGKRLYATFTRLRYRASTSLAAIQENDRFEANAAMTRFGGGMFFSSVQLKSDATTVEFEISSSFSKFGESGENTSLVRGQPDIPQDFSIPSLSAMPPFAEEYRQLRASDPCEAIFETEYEIVPQHDINGVGLLYFAAYPVIADICLARYLGPGAALDWSPVARDVCYFANSGAGDRLIFRLHHADPAGARRRFLGSLSRVSDGKRMALIDVTLERRPAP